jgi:hypothetical protein
MTPALAVLLGLLFGLLFVPLCGLILLAALHFCSLAADVGGLPLQRRRHPPSS